MSTPNSITVFVCKPDQLKCTTLGCRNFATNTCAFVLKGKKAGQMCDQAICSACVKDGLCVAHNKLVQRRNAPEP